MSDRTHYQQHDPCKPNADAVRGTNLVPSIPDESLADLTALTADLGLRPSFTYEGTPPDDDYGKYRGKCHEFCVALLKEDPTLSMVRGWYECPMWGRQQHWWCKKEDGTIVDPTVKQFPTKGVCAEYVEFDGMIDCEECGKRVSEEEAHFDGHHTFCSGSCYARCVGF